MPILKENLNAEGLNYSTYLLNYIDAILFYNLSSSLRQLENSDNAEFLGFSAINFFYVIFYLDRRVEVFFSLKEFCNS